MKYGIYAFNTGDLADAATLGDLAYAAEANGWHGFFVSDVLAPQRTDQPVVDLQVALTTIALRTNHIRFGPLVAATSRRRPAKLARETVSLDRLSDGRLIFGAGSGHELETEYARLGEPSERRVLADRMDESLSVIAGLWSGEVTNFEGDHYTVRDTVFKPTALQQPRIPVWCAVSPAARRTWRRAARWDGAFPLSSDYGALSPEQVRSMADYMAERRDDVAPFDIVVASGYPDNHPDPRRDDLSAYERAGATWWLMYAASLAQAVALVQSEPRS